MRFGHRFDQTGKAGNAPLRLDWLAGAAGFELANVIASYPFEMSRRFPAIKRNRI